MKLNRYIRQTSLKEFGPTSQKKLLDAKVLVVGAGGLGTPVGCYLNAMGIGTLGIIDNDIVSLSNLHRQVLFDESDINKSKVAVLLQKLKAQNSNTKIKAYDAKLDRDNAISIIANYDIVVDASDNFPTRYLINDACVILNKPFVYGALHGFEGQVSVFNHQGGPTYRCLFPKMPSQDEIPNCDEQGVLGVIPGIVGNLQALETVKVIAGIGEVLSGKLLLFNGLEQRFQKVSISKAPHTARIKELKPSYDLHCSMNEKAIASVKLEELVNLDEIQIIDVRTMEEYDSYHYENSINIPLNELIKRHSEIQFETPVYVLCQSGTRSLRAIQQMQEFYPKVTFINVEGGINQFIAHVAKY